MADGYNVHLLAAFELIRHARNNMLSEEFQECVREICVDGNLRYPLLMAGNVARDVHIKTVKEATRNIAKDIVG